jgi:NADPH2:quinone reductase
VSFTGNPKVAANFANLMRKRLHHTGSTLRPRTVAEKAAIARGIEERVWPFVASGKIKPVIDSTFPLAKASEAHARMETSLHIGKIVLTV